MITAQLHIEQSQVTVQVQEHNIEPIEVPMVMGASHWQYSDKTIIIQGNGLPALLSSGSYPLCIGKQMLNFKPFRFLGNGRWEGTIAVAYKDKSWAK